MACIFCRIVAGEIPCHKVWEDEKYLAFMDTHPMHPGHLLFIPKKHLEYLFGISNSEYTSLLLAAKKLVPAIQKATECKRVGLAVEGISVPHVHLHLVPVNKGNDLDPCKAEPMAKEELDRLALSIKENIGN